MHLCIFFIDQIPALGGNTYFTFSLLPSNTCILHHSTAPQSSSQRGMGERIQHIVYGQQLLHGHCGFSFLCTYRVYIYIPNSNTSQLYTLLIACVTRTNIPPPPHSPAAVMAKCLTCYTWATLFQHFWVGK